MEMITLTINGQTVQAPKNATILEAARSAGIHIPRCAIILNLLRKEPADCVS